MIAETVSPVIAGVRANRPGNDVLQDDQIEELDIAEIDHASGAILPLIAVIAGLAWGIAAGYLTT